MAFRSGAMPAACALGLLACAGNGPFDASGGATATAPPRAPGPPRQGEPRQASSAGGGVRDMPGVGWPQNVACTFRADAWRRAALHPRFHAAGSPYAEVLGGAENVRVALPVGEGDRGATVEFDAFGVRLRGVLEAAEARLYPAKPFVVGGVFVPDGTRPLLFRSAGAGSVTFELRSIPRVSFVGRASGLTVPCDSLGAGPSFFDPSGALTPNDLAASHAANLRHGVRVPVADSPGGPARATIVLGDDDPDDDVDVVAVRGASSRVLWRAGQGGEGEGGGLVFGWVPSSSLVVPGSALGRVINGLSGQGVVGRTDWGGCREDSPLWAEVDGERRVVGHVLAGTAVAGASKGAGDGADFVAVEIAGPASYAYELPAPAVRPAPGARLLMRRADFKRCGG